jgi:hypothetical protein
VRIESFLNFVRMLWILCHLLLALEVGMLVVVHFDALSATVF